MNEREELCKLIQSMSDDGIRTVRQVVDQVVRDELFAMIGTMSGDSVRKLRVQLENILTTESGAPVQPPSSYAAPSYTPTQAPFSTQQQGAASEYAAPQQGQTPSPFSSAPAPSPFSSAQPAAPVVPTPAPTPVPEPRVVVEAPRAEAPREEARREQPQAPSRPSPQSNNAIVYASGSDSEMTDRQVERCMATLRLIGAKPIKIFRDSGEQHEIDNALKHATDPANHITYFCVEERSKIATPSHDAKATEDILASAGVNLLLVEG